jgi:protein-disulfide isomerase
MPMLRVPVTPLDHIKGPANAPVTLVEYGDYECLFCGAAHPIVQAVSKRFGKKLRFVFRHFPMAQVHPFAESAAQSAEFAGAHGKFWEMHDGLYENQESLGLPLLFALARALDLSEDGLREALVTEEYAPKVRGDFLGGVRSGVNGTPTFFINGQRHDGSWAYDDLVDAIEASLHATASI